MSRDIAYMDWNASAPLLPEVRAALLGALDSAGNPSSVHERGREARKQVDAARRQVASLTNSKPDRIVFTSGATEAAQMVLTPHFQMGRSPIRFSKLYVCAADHPCTLSGGRFAEEDVRTFGVKPDGLADLDELKSMLAAHGKNAGLPLVCIHWVNNETGVIQPVQDIAAIVHDAGGTLVADAVQAAGRLEIDMEVCGVDFIILSGHKIGAPAGIGALIAGGDILMPSPLITGGGQERGHRGGTENLSGIAGFGAAAEFALVGLAKIDQIEVRRDRIEAAIRKLALDAVIYGKDAPRVANTTCFSLPGMKSETLQIAFDLAGVAVSAGSACSSGRTGPSHVMKAMGAEAESAIRVSIGHATADRDIEKFEDALRDIVARRKTAVQAA